jgi:hypothetical protein
MEIVQGIEGEPFFKTDEEYQRFREEFIEAVHDKLEENRRKRRLSEHEFFQKVYVNM